MKRGVLNDPHSFINSTSHMSFVWGDKNVEYLTKRYQALQQTTLFQGMQFSTDQQQIKKWAPLIIEGRDPNRKSLRPGRRSAPTSTTAKSPVSWWAA